LSEANGGTEIGRLGFGCAGRKSGRKTGVGVTKAAGLLPRSITVPSSGGVGGKPGTEAVDGAGISGKRAIGTEPGAGGSIGLGGLAGDALAGAIPGSSFGNGVGAVATTSGTVGNAAAIGAVGGVGKFGAGKLPTTASIPGGNSTAGAGLAAIPGFGKGAGDRLPGRLDSKSFATQRSFPGAASPTFCKFTWPRANTACGDISRITRANCGSTWVTSNRFTAVEKVCSGGRFPTWVSGISITMRAGCAIRNDRGITPSGNTNETCSCCVSYCKSSSGAAIAADASVNNATIAVELAIAPPRQYCCNVTALFVMMTCRLIP
jgi:hypothetical protein